jgi:hypothetical protein
MTNNQPISSGAIKEDALIALYENSPEARRYNSKLVNKLTGLTVSKNVQATTDFESEAIGSDSSFSLEIAAEDRANHVEAKEVSDVVTSKENQSPVISDITIYSGPTVVYDSTGTPSVSIVFKVGNPKKLDVKSIKVRMSAV